MSLSKHYERNLPFKRDLRLAYIASLVIASIMAFVSTAGLLYGTGIYPGLEAKVLPLFIGQDALNLVVGLPILLASMWLTHRGSLIGLLLWPGALFYFLYDYGYYVLGAPFNAFFLLYLALITLSGYTIICLVASTDVQVVHERLVRTVPNKLVGGFLAALALLFTTLWTLLTITALSSNTTLDPIPHVVVIMDLTVQLPALLVCGVLLWRREPVAYFIAAGLLLQAGLYLIGLSAITVLQEIVTAAPFDPVAVGPGIVVGVVSLALISPFWRGSTNCQEATSIITNIKLAEPTVMKT